MFDPDLDAPLKERFAAALDAGDFSRAEAAEIADVSVPTITRYKNPEHSSAPSILQVEALEEAARVRSSDHNDPERVASESHSPDRPTRAGLEDRGVRKGVRKGGAASGRPAGGRVSETRPGLSRANDGAPDDAVTREPSSPGEDTDGLSSDHQLVSIPLVVNWELAAHDYTGDGYIGDSDLIHLEPSGVNLPGWYIRSEYGVDPERCVYIRCPGNSMVPTIQPGQRGLFALLWPGSSIKDGRIYAIDAPGGGIVKRLYIEPDHVHVWSDNPDAPRYRIQHEVFERDYTLRAVLLETPQRH